MSERGTTSERPGAAEDLADFGFRRVPKADKATLVRDVFDTVARRYDVMNDLMSLGAHRVWKRALIDWLRPRPEMHLVDLAGGTGDIATRYLSAGGGRVTVVDINGEMLSVGRRRVARRLADGGGEIAWVQGDAERLPLVDGAADAVTIAFGIRNCTDIAAVLREARRVLKPGGRFLCLEFSRLALPGLAGLYDSYSFRLIPGLGAVVAGDRQAYRYLVESIRRFPDQSQFAAMIDEAGLARVNWRNLAGGVAAIHSAWRI
ncbi:MAG: class I SAM-dependent methyltransferase [Alphaproteobacteria bacterium]|nr:class I SAM-dependent methyltransferase [Alphaproteobacteria bacterium]